MKICIWKNKPTPIRSNEESLSSIIAPNRCVNSGCRGIFKDQDVIVCEHFRGNNHQQHVNNDLPTSPKHKKYQI